MDQLDPRYVAEQLRRQDLQIGEINELLRTGGPGSVLPRLAALEQRQDAQGDRQDRIERFNWGDEGLPDKGGGGLNRRMMLVDQRQQQILTLLLVMIVLMLVVIALLAAFIYLRV